MGLGALHTVSLEDARAKATAYRKLLQEGIDPIEPQKAEHTRARLDAAKSISFNDCASSYINAHKAGWLAQPEAREPMGRTLETYTGPVFGALPVRVPTPRW